MALKPSYILFKFMEWKRKKKKWGVFIKLAVLHYNAFKSSTEKWRSYTIPAPVERMCCCYALQEEDRLCHTSSEKATVQMPLHTTLCSVTAVALNWWKSVSKTRLENHSLLELTLLFILVGVSYPHNFTLFLFICKSRWNWRAAPPWHSYNCWKDWTSVFAQ